MVYKNIYNTAFLWRLSPEPVSNVLWHTFWEVSLEKRDFLHQYACHYDAHPIAYLFTIILTGQELLNGNFYCMFPNVVV